MTDISLRRALFVSLVLNLFVGCALIAGVVEWRHARHGVGDATPAAQTKWLRRAAVALPAEQRHALRQVLRSSDQGLMTEARAARADAARLVAAPGYDAAATAAAFERARRADFAVRAGVEVHLAAFIGSLPPTSRAALADAMRPHERRDRTDRDF